MSDDSESVVDSISDQEFRDMKKFERGHRRIQMIRACVEQKGTWASIAARFNITPEALYHWRMRHAEEIETLAANTEDACSVLWAANKANRIAEYQRKYEDVDDMLDGGADQAQVLLKVQMTALENIAKELGHLNPKDNSERTQVDVHLHGVDMDKL